MGLALLLLSTWMVIERSRSLKKRNSDRKMIGVSFFMNLFNQFAATVNSEFIELST